MSTTTETKTWSKGKRRLVLGGIGLTAVLLLVYWNYTTFFGGLMSADPKSIDCIPTRAIVTDIHASGGGSKKSRETYHMTYQYKVNDQTFTEKDEVTYAIYNRMRLGADVEICYMKEKPSRSAVIGNDVRGQSYFIVLLVDLVIVIALVLIVRSWFTRKKKGTTTVESAT
jgi:hypothetical protein